MKLGVLTKINVSAAKGDPEVLRQLLQLALKNFRNAGHLKGHYPAEIHFAPAELPETFEVDGMTVLPDDQVRAGHVRVTTIDLPDPTSLAGELNLEKAAFAGQVAEAAYGGS